MAFDADGPGTSDLDLTLVGDGPLLFFKATGFFVPGVHSRPLSDTDPDIAPDLVPLREKLMRMWVEEPNLTLEELGEISCPALVMVGDRDIVPIDHTIELWRATRDEIHGSVFAEMWNPRTRAFAQSCRCSAASWVRGLDPMPGSAVSL